MRIAKASSLGSFFFTNDRAGTLERSKTEEVDGIWYIEEVDGIWYIDGTRPNREKLDGSTVPLT